MPEFISKVQHKNYETGEFSAEKPRDLEETIALIKAFPWEDERHLTDIQLTGPSVTICNEANEYLKIGLYFNGKFALYYLDKKNHLYERYVYSLDKVVEVVTDFFDSKFDKNSFKRNHFEFQCYKYFNNKDFNYKFNKNSWGIIFIFSCIYAFVCTGTMLLFISKEIYSPILICIIPYLIIYKLINHYIYSKDVVLNTSRGKITFTIVRHGITSEYYKKDVKEIILPMFNNNKQDTTINELVFNNGQRIRLSSLLINSLNLSMSFPDTKKVHRFRPFSVLSNK